MFIPFLKVYLSLEFKKNQKHSYLIFFLIEYKSFSVSFTELIFSSYRFQRADNGSVEKLRQFRTKMTMHGCVNICKHIDLQRTHRF